MQIKLNDAEESDENNEAEVQTGNADAIPSKAWLQQVLVYKFEPSQVEEGIAEPSAATEDIICQE